MNAATVEVPAAKQNTSPPAVGPPALSPTAPDLPAPSPAAPSAPVVMRASQVWQPPRKKMRMIVLTMLIATGAVPAVLTAWNLPPFAGGVERTDNAYVRGLTMNVAPQVS